MGTPASSTHLIPLGLCRVPEHPGFGFTDKIAKGIHLQGTVQVCKEKDRQTYQVRPKRSRNRDGASAGVVRPLRGQCISPFQRPLQKRSRTDSVGLGVRRLRDIAAPPTHTSATPESPLNPLSLSFPVCEVAVGQRPQRDARESEQIMGLKEKALNTPRHCPHAGHALLFSRYTVGAL